MRDLAQLYEEYPDIERFLSRCKRQDKCLIWEGATNSNGVPVASYKGSLISVRKHIYLQLHGEIPEGKVVSHTFQSPQSSLCLDPDHLIARTPREIQAERQRQDPRAKVAVKVRQLYATGDFNQADVAKKCKTSPSSVASMIRGDSWKAVGGFPDGKTRIRRRFPRRFTDSQILNIRNSRGKITIREIARQHESSYIYMSQIVNGRRRQIMFCGHPFESAESRNEVWFCKECGEKLE